MIIPDVYEALKDKFGAKIKENKTPPHGDGYILVEPWAIKDVCRFLKFEDPFFFNILHCLSAVDLKDRLAVTYHLYSSKHSRRAILRAEVPSQNPHIPSVAGVWLGANWHEREAYDMAGVIFDGHPDLRRILCPEDWDGFPLRKDYKVQEYWHGLHVPYVERAGEEDGTFVFGRPGAEGLGLPTRTPPKDSGGGHAP